MPKKLTKGQASCLVLDMIPTKENRDLAKWKLQSIGLAPTYTNETSAMEPLAIAATLQKKNPFKYMSYDDTPPSSPSESGVKRSYEQMSSSSESTDDYRVDITKEYVLDVLHALCLLKDPEDNEKYERAFLTNDDVWDVLKDFIDGLCDTFSPKQLAKWMANDGSWGQLERRQADGARQRGRQLHLLKSQYRGNAVDNVKNINSYRAFVHVDAEKWTIVGYARKSMTDEDDSTRQRLLNGMLTKLKTKLLCRKVFVSPCSSADMEFSKRDTSKRSLKFMESLKCDGTTQDLLLFLKAETRMVRLIAIDYAGLSTNVEDLRSLVSNHKCVKEIVIDKGHRVELFSRKQLLKDDEVLRLFRCRTKAVNRSS